MIEFYGTMSEQCKMLIAKKRAMHAGFIFTLVNLIAASIVLIFGIINNKLLFALIITVILILLIFPAFIVPKERIAIIKINSRILIDTNNVSISYSTNLYTNNLNTTKKINEIKKIYDFDICYCIIFKYGDISNSWVCEKQLISKGTIEEFEKIFENKIVRKIK